MISSQSDRMRWYLFWVFVSLFVVVSFLTILSLFFGIGNLNERHEGKLVTAFVLEVGGAIAGLFYSLFALKRPAMSETSAAIPAEKNEPNVQENVASLQVMTRLLIQLSKSLWINPLCLTRTIHSVLMP